MMELSTRNELVIEALENMRYGTTIAAQLKQNASSGEVRELAEAVHFIGFGAQQIGLALSDAGRVNDLQLQRELLNELVKRVEK